MAQTIDIFTTGVVAGAFYFGAVGVHPAAARLDASSHLLLRQELSHRLQKALPPLMLAPLPAVIGAVAFCSRSVSIPLDALGCALSIATIAITMMVNAPLNRHFVRWLSETLPSDWQQLVRRWNVAHKVRTATALGAFVCALLAVK